MFVSDPERQDFLAVAARQAQDNSDEIQEKKPLAVQQSKTQVVVASSASWTETLADIFADVGSKLVDVAILAFILGWEGVKIVKWMMSWRIFRIWVDLFLQFLFVSILSFLFFNVALMSALAGSLRKRSVENGSRHQALTQLQKTSFDFLHKAISCVSFWVCQTDIDSNTSGGARQTDKFTPLFSSMLPERGEKDGQESENKGQDAILPKNGKAVAKSRRLRQKNAVEVLDSGEEQEDFSDSFDENSDGSSGEDEGEAANNIKHLDSPNVNGDLPEPNWNGRVKRQKSFEEEDAEARQKLAELTWAQILAAEAAQKSEDDPGNKASLEGLQLLPIINPKAFSADGPSDRLSDAKASIYELVKKDYKEALQCIQRIRGKEVVNEPFVWDTLCKDFNDAK